MGYTTTQLTLKELIREQTEGWESEATAERGRVTVRCIAKCFKGDIRRKGRLWSVWERLCYGVDGKVVDKDSRRYIVLHLMDCEGKKDGWLWGYKDMDESMHPYYYDCPLSYLKLAPDEHGEGSAEWRKGVREYHAKLSAGIKAYNSAKEDDILVLKPGVSPRSIRVAVVQTWTGKNGRVTRRHVVGQDTDFRRYTIKPSQVRLNLGPVAIDGPEVAEAEMSLRELQLS